MTNRVALRNRLDAVITNMLDNCYPKDRRGIHTGIARVDMITVMTDIVEQLKLDEERDQAIAKQLEVSND